MLEGLKRGCISQLTTSQEEEDPVASKDTLKDTFLMIDRYTLDFLFEERNMRDECEEKQIKRRQE